MKTHAPKTTSSALQPQKGNQPFFQKEGEGAFFSQNQVQLKAGNEYQSVSPFFGNHPGSTPFFSSATIQPKLTIGQPGDKYEQEADAMADQVVQKLAETAVQKVEAPTTNNQQPITSYVQPSLQPQTEEAPDREGLEQEEALQPKPIFESNGDPEENGIQRKCAACEQKEKGALSPKLQLQPLPSTSKPAGIQRKCTACQAETIQPKSIQMQGGRGAESATPGLESRLNATKGGGSPLPKDTRSSMESAFGADFSSVRVHTNSGSVQMNQELGAQAFTYGSDVYFNQGKYDTGSSDGQRLLAHELTHTIQQGSVGPSTKLQENKIQRKKTGEKVQDALRPVNSGLITEAPIPGAAPRGRLSPVSPTAFNVMGYADLYKASGNKIPGIRGIIVEQIPTGPHAGKKKYVYANVTSLDNTEGPYSSSPELSGGTGKYARFAVDESNNSIHLDGHNAITGNFPSKIYLGEIKGMDTLLDNPLLGPGQLSSYKKGLGRFTRSAQRDFGLRVQIPDFENLSGLDIPAGLNYDNFDQEHRRSSQGKIIENRNRIWLAEVGGTGVYLWARLPHPYNIPSNVDQLRRRAIERLREDILEEFNKIKQKKAGPKLSPKLLPETERQDVDNSQKEEHTSNEVGRIQKISEADQPIQRKTNWKAARQTFNNSLKTWKRQHAKAFLDNDQVEKYLEPKVEFDKELNRKDSSTSKFRDDTQDYRKIEFWNSPKGKIIGNLRILLGEKFDALAEKVERLKKRTRSVKAKAGKLSSPKFSKGWMGRIVKLLLKGFKVGFEEFLEYSFEVFAECINAVIEKFEEEMRQKIVEGLVDEELEASLNELKTELESLIASLQEKYEEQLVEYEEIVEQMKDAGFYTSIISTAVNLIRLGVQVVSCFTPPALGCLWGIAANLTIEVALNLVVGTEWFEEEFMKPLVKDLLDDFLKDTLLKFLQGLFDLVGLGEYVEGIEACTPKDIQDRISAARFHNPDNSIIISKDQYEQYAKAWEAANKDVLMNGVVSAFGGTATTEDIEKFLKVVKEQNIDHAEFNRILEESKAGEGSFDFGKVSEQLPGLDGESEEGEGDAKVKTIDGNKSHMEGEPTGSTTTVTIHVENISHEHRKSEPENLTLLIRHGDNFVRIYNVKVVVSNRYYYDTRTQSRVRDRASANYMDIVYKITEPKGYSLPFPDRKLFLVYGFEFGGYLKLK